VKDNTKASLIVKNIPIEELFGLVYDELNDLVHYLAIRYSDGNSEVLMEKDEIVGELYTEVWKGCLYYHKKAMKLEAFLALLKVMLTNRIAELRYRYFKTHRKASQFNISIDVYINSEYIEYDNSWNEERLNCSPVQDLITTVGIDPADIMESEDFIYNVRQLLDSTAQEVFDALVYGNELLTMHVWLSAVRANNVYKSSGSAKIKPYHIASALCKTEVEVKVALKQISKTVHEVDNERNQIIDATLH
jgi:hypothetical protein